MSALYSLSLAVYSFVQKGFSRQYRKLLMRRHISFCILTIFCQLTATINYLQVTGTVDFPNWIQAACIYYFCFVSVMLALLRLNEPIVMSTFKRDVLRVFCCASTSRKSEDMTTSTLSSDCGSSDQDSRGRGIEDNDILSDTLSSFLTSSLNVELVYTILKGIRRIVKTPDLETWKNGQVPENNTNDFSMRLTLDNIKIRNFKLWENAHQ